jgi:enoyl-CoA hydratase/carnithine racemase
MKHEFATLAVHEDTGVLFIQMSSPPMNMIGPGLVADLVQIIKMLDEGTTHRVAVFSSTDQEFFLNHVDIKRVHEYREAAAALTGEPSLGLLFRRLSTTKAVTIAKIRGRARGAGSEFALACDMRFASAEKAIFGQIESGFGVVPGGGAVQHLTRLLGRGRAMEVICSALDYSAEQAERYGWINRALPDSELDGFVDSLARRMARFSHEGLIANKQRINDISLASVEEYRTDSSLFGSAFAKPATMARVQELLARGLQQEGNFERDLGIAIDNLGA